MGTEGVRTKRNWMKNLDYMLLDFVFTMGVYFVACVVRLHQISAPFASIYWDMALALIPMILVVQLGTNPHRDAMRRPAHKELSSAMEYISEVTVLLLLYQYLTQVGGEFSRGAFIYFWILGTFVVFIARTLYKKILRKIVSNKSRNSRVVLVLDGENLPDKIEYFRAHGEEQYCISAVTVLRQGLETESFVLPSEEAASDNLQPKVLYSLDELYEHVENDPACEVLISISDVEAERQIIRELLLMGITSHVNLNRVYEGMPNMQVETLAEQLVITSSIQPFSPVQRVVKRLGDIVGSIVGLILTFLVFLIIGPIIKIQSRGPIFFSQTRVGKNGKPFRMYKFRSMYVDAEARKAALMEQNEMSGPMFKIADDPRITPIGRFIRKYSIDELPQFWNVLTGDMSLVGTRPPTVDEWERYNRHNKARLAIKPGITGLWQVSGRNNIIDFEEVVALDIKYIQEWSVLEDVRILLRTVGVVLGAVGAK